MSNFALLQILSENLNPTSQTKHLAKNILKKVGAFKIVSLALSRDKKRYFPDGDTAKQEGFALTKSEPF